MRMKKTTLLLVAALLCGTFTAQAQVLSVYKTDGSKESISLSEVQSVTFGEESTETQFASGQGTAEAPYVISSVKELQTMAQLVNSGDSAYLKAAYKLDADLDISDIEWTPIGEGKGNTVIGLASNGAFLGSFNGNGHTISGLNINATTTEPIAMYGLFGFVGSKGSVTNLTVKGNVNVTSTATSESDKPYLIIGGIVGKAFSANIDNCSFQGNITGTSSVEGAAVTVGGVVGHMVGTLTNATVTLYATQSITATGTYANAGGVAGYVDSGSLAYCVANITGQVKADCGATTTTEESSANAGGLIGYSFGGSVQQCVATIDGLISAYAVPESGAESSFATAAAGGLCGGYAADQNAQNTVTVNGSVLAEGGSSTAAGGVIGMQNNAGYSGSGLTATVAGTISAIGHNSSASKSIAYAGGIYGYGTFQTSVSAISYCTATISGTISAKNEKAAYAGGIAGGTAQVTACHATISQTGKISADAPTLANCGGVVGLPSSNVGACYAIVDGQLTVGESNAAAVGGVIGGISGSRRSAKNITGCYALINGTLSGPEAATVGAVTGKLGSYCNLLGSYWWSSSDTVKGAFSDDEGDDYKFASRDEAGLTAVLDDMNTALEEGDYACKYVYDSESNSLVLVSTSTEGE